MFWLIGSLIGDLQGEDPHKGQHTQVAVAVLKKWFD